MQGNKPNDTTDNWFFLWSIITKYCEYLNRIYNIIKYKNIKVHIHKLWLIVFISFLKLYFI